MGVNESSSKTEEINVSPNSASNDNLKVLFNNHLVINVDKESVMKNSLYFRAMLSDSFKQSPSGLLQVNHDVDDDVIKQVLTCMVNDKWEFNVQNTFDVYRLACYLQISSPELEKVCWDNFKNSLKEEQLNKQIKLFQEDNCLYSFKEKALEFKKSKRPSLNGFYMLVDEVVGKVSDTKLEENRRRQKWFYPVEERRLAFKMFNKDSGKMVDLEAPAKGSFSAKECELVTVDDKILLYNDSMYHQFSLSEYDLFSGHWKSINCPKLHSDMTISCVYEKKLYVFSFSHEPEMRKCESFSLQIAVYNPSNGVWSSMSKIDSFITCGTLRLFAVYCVEGVFYVIYHDGYNRIWCCKALNIKTLDVLPAAKFNSFLKKHGLYCWFFAFENQPQLFAFKQSDRTTFKGVVYDLSKNTENDFEFSWPSTLKRRYREVSLMQEGKEKYFYILESSRDETFFGKGRTRCEFYCVENIPNANTWVHKEMFETQLKDKSYVLKFIPIGEHFF